MKKPGEKLTTSRVPPVFLGDFLRRRFLGALALGSLVCSCHKSAGEEQRAPSPSSPAPTEKIAAPAPEPPAEPAPSPAVPTPPPRQKYVVAALGDSITDGRSGGGGYLKVLRQKCPESTFLDFGKGGDMTNQMRRRFSRDILPRVASDKIDTLLVYGGVNDLYSDLTAGRKNERIESDLAGIYAEAKNAGLRVVAVTVSPWGGFSKYYNARRGQNTRLLNSWILGQVATGAVDVAVDSFPLLSCGNADVLCPEYETSAHDGLHPGPQGHDILGQKLAHQAFHNCL